MWQPLSEAAFLEAHKDHFIEEVLSDEASLARDGDHPS